MSFDRIKDQNTLSGRLKRYARVGGAVGGLAARFARARYFGATLDRKNHARQLRDSLGELKGPLMKVAQILSTVPNVLPPEYTKELSQLQSNAPAMGWLFVKRRMANELGPNWQSHFKEFSHTAAAAASLGQVHKAKTYNDVKLACKLQYPDMLSVVEADLRQLQVIFGVYRRYDRAIDPDEIHKEISNRLREELDYKREATHMDLYRLMLKGEKKVHVPKPYPKFSTEKLLTMSWLEGSHLLEVKNRPIEERNQIAKNMFRAWYVPFYHYGVIHGDPHLGNYSVRQNGSINLLDFGCIRVFGPSFVQGVIDLYNSLRNHNKELAVHAYETWGFSNLGNDVIDILNLWAKFVYAPLLEDKTRRIQEGKGFNYGAEVAAKVHKELHKLGGVKPPKEFVLMDRAAVGLGSVFTHLAAEVNWYELFHTLIKDFDMTVLSSKQAAALLQAKVPNGR